MAARMPENDGELQYKCSEITYKMSEFVKANVLYEANRLQQMFSLKKTNTCVNSLRTDSSDDKPYHLLHHHCLL